MGWYLALVGLVFQAALVVFAIRTHRIMRTTTTRFIMWAAVCYVVAASSWYTFNFAAGFLLKSAAGNPEARHTVAECRYYSDQTFQMLFAVLMIAALVSIVRERSASSKLSV